MNSRPIALHSKVHFKSQKVRMSPPAVLACGFLGLIVLGALLLKLPFATTDSITVQEALFTATSAVTVTGLVVVDTGTDFTRFGQTVIALLIQAGGLGLMTFAVVALLAIGGKIGFRQQIIATTAFNQTSWASVAQTAKAVLLFALVVEAIGFVILFARWWPDMALPDAAFEAFFYTISAFNNAGFALAADSLSGFVGDATINLTITLLFIAGGLGFGVWMELWQTRSWRRLSIYSQVLIASIVIINVVAMVLILLLEANNQATLAGLTMSEQIWAAWFQATTPRTAGFNTIDIASLEDSTTTLMLLLMFIGGGSLSTASGIKVMTFVVLVMATYAYLRQRDEVVINWRSIPRHTVRKALAVALISAFTIWLSIFLLTVTHKAPFLDIVFEAVSAFSTVGLSRGMTGELSLAGQWIIMLLMFVGRLGPLTMAYFLARPKPKHLKYPEAKFPIG
ncbi:TrkH family potassium uptake protein [Aliidiomarina soli]|uniref:Ktr system potassium transporter B n=1 Tax=Aliidiomarina soli TaxID=1928574 RepID=A0A432WJD4_9GAMM|nr:TrkH family potassium uptake protein [Aliidiomarina soli]RUO33789.1 Ktr system potassium transporter B [Aliidiomarina soli]